MDDSIFMFNKVLTVCTGNICRSPAAEGILKAKLRAKQPRIEIQSAGTGALVGHGADQTVIKLLAEKNIDLSQHRARQLKTDLVAWSDLILVMEKMHLEDIERDHPTARGKVFCLGKWRQQNIPDPFRENENFFIENISLIEACIDDWYNKLWSNNA